MSKKKTSEPLKKAPKSTMCRPISVNGKKVAVLSDDGNVYLIAPKKILTASFLFGQNK